MQYTDFIDKKIPSWIAFIKEVWNSYRHHTAQLIYEVSASQLSLHQKAFFIIFGANTTSEKSRMDKLPTGTPLNFFCLTQKFANKGG